MMFLFLISQVNVKSIKTLLDFYINDGCLAGCRVIPIKNVWPLWDS